MINLRVRAKNPVFWFQVFLSIAVPVGAYFGVTGQDMTSWSKLFELIVNALSNPYVLFTVGVSLFNALNDPTVKGISDSKQVMEYDAPKDDK